MKREDGEDGRVRTNREMAMRAKPGLHWCGGCDRNHVGQAGKCEVCGRRANRFKRKGL